MNLAASTLPFWTGMMRGCRESYWHKWSILRFSLSRLIPPPLVGTNTQRIQSFLRHLPKFGWHSTVITQEIDDLPVVDLRDLERIPADARVIRVPNPDPFARRARSVKTASKRNHIRPAKFRLRWQLSIPAPKRACKK